MKVLICGTCPPHLNSNYNLIQYAFAGFLALNTHDVKLVELFELIRAISEWKPDTVLLLGGLALKTIPLHIIRHLCNYNNAQLALWSWEDPYEIDYVVNHGHHLDLICTNDFSSLWFYPAQWNLRHLPLGAIDQPSPEPGLNLSNDKGWLFCGVPFSNRRDWIQAIHRKTPEGLLIGPDWPKYQKPTITRNERISPSILHALYVLMPAVIYLGRDLNLANNSKVIPSTPGPRLFEAAGCGSCQIACGTAMEAMQYFEPEVEMLFAETPAEAVEQIERAKIDDSLREKVSLNAWKRAQSEHLYQHRAAKIIHWLHEVK